MSKLQDDIRNLLDLHTPLSKEDLAQIMGPLEPNAKAREPVKRQPYDRLYLKLKANRDYWSGN